VFSAFTKSRSTGKNSKKGIKEGLSNQVLSNKEFFDKIGYAAGRDPGGHIPKSGGKEPLVVRPRLPVRDPNSTSAPGRRILELGECPPTENNLRLLYP